MAGFRFLVQFAAAALCMLLLSLGSLENAQAHTDSCWHGLDPAKGKHALSCNFYDSLGHGITECVYKITEGVVAEAMRKDPTIPAALLRMHFHDCFVNGCDASVLLEASRGKDKGQAEKDAPPNLTLDGFEVIDDIKAAVDQHCSPHVSCADILAVTAAVVVHVSGGPQYDVPLGRLDGCTSEKDMAPHYLPSAQATVRGVYNGASHSLQDAFAVQGLSLYDLVTLAGAHTIGTAHCANFKDRLCYDKQFSPMPINKMLQHKLQACCLHNKPGACTGNIDAVNPVNTPQTSMMADLPDPVTPKVTFDNAYYKNLQDRIALLTSDQSLYYDPATARLVDEYAADQDAWFEAFVKSIVRMGNIIPSNMGVTPGAGMKLCNNEKIHVRVSFENARVFGKPHKFYGPTCSKEPAKGEPDSPPACLAYKKNMYHNRRGRCGMASPRCKPVPHHM